MIKAAKAGYLRECPGLKESLIRKFVIDNVETHQGHMKQSRQNVRNPQNRSQVTSKPTSCLLRWKRWMEEFTVTKPELSQKLATEETDM
eukprot:2870391-Ditylum_brightwellii.AAC.1